MFSKIRLCPGCGHPVGKHSVYRPKCLGGIQCRCQEYAGDTFGTGKLATLLEALNQLGVKGVLA